jgi:hypothetical protein
MTNQELLSEMVCDWMRENLPKYDYGSGFDLAVDCTYDLGLHDAYTLNEWETIPHWIVRISEAIYNDYNKDAGESF